MAAATYGKQREVWFDPQNPEQAWVRMLDDSQSFLGDPTCTPGYYNNEGKPMGRRDRLNAGRYPQGPVAYFHYIDGWRNSGDFEGLEFRTKGAVAGRREGSEEPRVAP